MSINKNMEVTRKLKEETCFWWPGQEIMDAYLIAKRHELFKHLDIEGLVTLNEVYVMMNSIIYDKSREGLVFGWEQDESMTENGLFTWAFCADGTVELTFHNLKDISNLYKTEEELA